MESYIGVRNCIPKWEKEKEKERQRERDRDRKKGGRKEGKKGKKEREDSGFFFSVFLRVLNLFSWAREIE